MSVNRYPLYIFLFCLAISVTNLHTAFAESWWDKVRLHSRTEQHTSNPRLNNPGDTQAKDALPLDKNPDPLITGSVEKDKKTYPEPVYPPEHMLEKNTRASTTEQKTVSTKDNKDAHVNLRAKQDNPVSDLVQKKSESNPKKITRKAEKTTKDNANIEALREDLKSSINTPKTSTPDITISEKITVENQANVNNNSGINDFIILIDGEYTLGDLMGFSTLNTQILSNSLLNPGSSVAGQLKLRQSGILQTNRLYLGGRAFGLGIREKTNTATKFPVFQNYGSTFDDQKKHKKLFDPELSANATFTFGDWLLLSGVVTKGRTDIYDHVSKEDMDELRFTKSHIVFGSLTNSPLFAAVGTGPVEFGRLNSLSPLTPTLNYKMFMVDSEKPYFMLGFDSGSIRFSTTALRGGRQNRIGDVSGDEGDYKNFAANLRGRIPVEVGKTLVAGAGYLRGTYYNDTVALSSTTVNTDRMLNDAYSLFIGMESAAMDLSIEYTSTLDPWPLTNKKLSTLAVQSAFRIDTDTIFSPELSLGYNLLQAGPSGTEYARSQQIIAGLAFEPIPHYSVGIEYIHSQGYLPIDTITTESDASVKSNTVQVGMSVQF